MGWSIECTPSRLKDFLKGRTSGWDWVEKETGIKHTGKCITSKYVMSNPGCGTLFKVMETASYDKAGQIVEGPKRWIGIDLIKWYGGRNRSDGWGYKDMDESCGVGNTSCPLVYIDKLAPDPKPHANPSCDKDSYGPSGCKCSGCHGCGTCWSLKWRAAIRAAAHRKQALRRLVMSLAIGDQVVVAKGYTSAGSAMTITEIRGKGAGLKVICGYTRMPLKAIDLEASVALRTGVQTYA